MNQRRYELTDFELSIIQPQPANKRRGIARVVDRKVLNGIYWWLRTGSPWAESQIRGGIEGLRRRSANDRRILDPCASAWRQRRVTG
jgi:transposase